MRKSNRINIQHVQSRGGVTPTSNKKQVQDIGAKFRCEVARNGKLKKLEFYPPNFFGGKGVTETAKGESTTEYRVKNP